MDIYSAISDPTRREILELLALQGPLSAGEISAKFSVTPPAISQHLKVLRETNLVQMEKLAQQRIYFLNLETIQEVEKWAAGMTELWNQRFDALDQVLNEYRSEKSHKSGSGTRRSNQ